MGSLIAVGIDPLAYKLLVIDFTLFLANIFSKSNVELGIGTY